MMSPVKFAIFHVKFILPRFSIENKKGIVSGQELMKALMIVL